MIKRTLFSFTMIAVSFLTGYAAAQSYFLNKAPAQAKQTLASAESEQSIAPPNDFQSQTQQLEQKKNQALSDQLKQELAKVPPTPPPTNTPPATSPEGTKPEAVTTPPPSDAAPTEQGAAQAAAPPAGPAPATPPASAPSQSQVYTGFQNSDSNQPAPPANNSNQPAPSGGWNIKY